MKLLIPLMLIWISSCSTNSLRIKPDDKKLSLIELTDEKYSEYETVVCKSSGLSEIKCKEAFREQFMQKLKARYLVDINMIKQYCVANKVYCQNLKAVEYLAIYYHNALIDYKESQGDMYNKLELSVSDGFVPKTLPLGAP